MFFRQSKLSFGNANDGPEVVNHDGDDSGDIIIMMVMMTVMMMVMMMVMIVAPITSKTERDSGEDMTVPTLEWREIGNSNLVVRNGL